MNTGHRRTHLVSLFAAATLIAGSIFLYRIRPLTRITFGSSAIALAVLAHLGILAALVGPFVAWRRRRRRNVPIDTT
jgi:hypothetical protein